MNVNTSACLSLLGISLIAVLGITIKNEIILNKHIEDYNTTKPIPESVECLARVEHDTCETTVSNGMSCSITFNLATCSNNDSSYSCSEDHIQGWTCVKISN